MTIKQELVDEIEVLLRYNLDSTQEGIKVHHTAREGLIAATQRLHTKGLVDSEDGGYLTDLGHEAAEHTGRAPPVWCGTAAGGPQAGHLRSQLEKTTQRFQDDTSVVLAPHHFY